MSQPYVGEIRIFAGDFAPLNWALCQGQLMAISENETLFALIGTTYGGDGQSNFNLPNLSSRVPIHFGLDSFGNNYPLGQSAGVESVTLTVAQIPQHTHTCVGAAAANSSSPSGSTWADGVDLYSSASPSVTLNPTAVSPAGGSQPHDNLMPFLGLNFIIALFGVFPSQ